MLIDPPIGTPEERATGAVWPGTWENDNPLGNLYTLKEATATTEAVKAYHTGADLNNNKPSWNSDSGMPVYAIADGYVTFSAKGSGSWGWLIIIRHFDDSGKPFYSRYAHTNHIAWPVVQAGTTVKRGDLISHVGDADGVYAPGGQHLHFDISTTDILAKNPNDWPGLNLAYLKANYVEPKAFILEKRKEDSSMDLQALRDQAAAVATSATALVASIDAQIAAGGPATPPTKPPSGVPAKTATVTATKLNIRNVASTSGQVVGTLKAGDTVNVYDAGDTDPDGNQWVQIADGLNQNNWIAKGNSKDTFQSF